jgi:hypothetical protein
MEIDYFFPFLKSMKEMKLKIGQDEGGKTCKLGNRKNSSIVPPPLLP